MKLFTMVKPVFGDKYLTIHGPRDETILIDYDDVNHLLVKQAAYWIVETLNHALKTEDKVGN